MIQITDDQRRVPSVSLGAIWLGDSTDEASADLDSSDVGAVLNVARDLDGKRCWGDGVEVMRVGLVDGPGNTMSAYMAALVALHSMLRRHNVLVCCHTGSRSLAVSIMYLGTTAGHKWPGDWATSWEGWLRLLRNRTGKELPEPHEAHREAFGNMKWRILAELMKD